MWTIPHNERDHDTVPVSGENRSWNNQQIHAEVLRAEFNVMEGKVRIPQAWLYGGYSVQETAVRGVIILRREDREKVLDFLGSYSLTCHVREVKLTPEDEEKLSQFHE